MLFQLINSIKDISFKKARIFIYIDILFDGNKQIFIKYVFVENIIPHSWSVSAHSIYITILIKTVFGALERKSSGGFSNDHSVSFLFRVF